MLTAVYFIVALVGFVRVPVPAPADLQAAQFGTRHFTVHFSGDTLVVARAAPSPPPPFAAAVVTSSMGEYGTQPAQMLRLGNAWFLAFDHGEFGGGLWVFNAGGSVGRRLLGVATDNLVRYGNSVLASTGAAAPFFLKPLRIYRFEQKNGVWQGVAHTDFAFNIVRLTNIGGGLYGITAQSGHAALSRIDLSGRTAPIATLPDHLNVDNIVKSGDRFGIGAVGYALRLTRGPGEYTASWYAPRDCVRYTVSASDDESIDARCVGAPGSASYARELQQPASPWAVSRTGAWMIAQGPSLLHFTNGRWRQTALSEAMVYAHAVEGVGGEPVLGTDDSIWIRRSGRWSRIGAGSCTSVIRMAQTAAWCLSVGEHDSKIIRASYTGSVLARPIPAVVRSIVPDVRGGAWFSVEGLSEIGRVTAEANVSYEKLSTPVATLSGNGDTVWFTEADRHHYGYARGGHVYELTHPIDFPIDGIVAAPRGAWLEEIFPGERRMLRYVDAAGSEVFGRYIADVAPFRVYVSPDGTAYAGSARWPVIMELTPSGDLTRYRLPCAYSTVRLLPAPGNAVWFVSRDPGCSGMAGNGALQVRGLPPVRITDYK